MADIQESHSRDLLISIRKITRTIDLHSKYLKKKFGLTIPQLVILQEIKLSKEISITDLSKTIDLSQATVTDIVNRLVKNQLVSKERSTVDKRMVVIKLMEKGKALLEQAPPPLQKTFSQRFASLEDWEQLMLMSALQRIVSLMSAEEIDAAPILTSDPEIGAEL